MRNSGYAENIIVEVSAALGILAKYNILGTGVVTNANSSVSCFNMPGIDHTNSSNSNNNVLGALGQISLDSYLSTVTPSTGTSIDNMDIFRHSSIPNHALSLNNNNNFSVAGNPNVQSVQSFNKNLVATDLAGKEKNVEIPEVIVGAILGTYRLCIQNFEHMRILITNHILTRLNLSLT